MLLVVAATRLVDTMADEFQLEIDPGTHLGAITEVLTAPDTDTFCTVGSDRRLRVWRRGRATPYRTLLAPRGPGPKTRIDAAALHPSGAWLVMALSSPDPDQPGLVSQLWIYDIEADTVESQPWPSPIGALAFDRNGHAVFVADRANLSILEADAVAAAADAEDVLSEQVVLSQPLDDEVWALALAPVIDGLRLFAITAGQRVPQAFDLTEDGLSTVSLDGGGEGEQDLAVWWPGRLATSAETLAVAGANEVLLADLDGGNPRRIALGDPDDEATTPDEPPGIALTPDGSRLVVGAPRGPGSEVVVYDITEEPRIIGRRAVDDDAGPVGVLDRSTVVATGGRRRSIVVWTVDAESEPEPEADPDSERGGDQTIEGIGFGPRSIGIAGEIIGFGAEPSVPGSTDQSCLTRRFDLTALELEESPESDDLGIYGSDPVDDDFEDLFELEPDPSTDAPAPAEAPALADEELVFDTGRHERDGLRLVVAEGELRLEPGAGQRPGPPMVLLKRPEAYGFIGPDRVVATDSAGDLWLFEPGEEPDDVEETDGPDQAGPGDAVARRLLARDVAAVDLAADDRWLVAAGADQVIRLWFLADLEAGGTGPVPPVLQLFVTNDDQWVLWSRSGYYVSSVQGDELLLHVHSQGDDQPPVVFTSDRFVDQLYRPSIVEAVVATGDEERALTELGLGQVDPTDSLDLPPVVENVEVLYDEAVPTLALVRFDVVDQGGPPADRVSILVNGQAQWEGSGEPSAAGPYEEFLFLDTNLEVNEIRIVAESDLARSTPVDRQVPPVVDPTLSPVGGVPVAPSISAVEEPLVSGTIVLPAEPPIEYHLAQSDVIGFPGLDVTGGRVQVELSAELDHDTEVLAVRNDTELLRAQIAPGVRAEMTVDLALVDGQNHLLVTAQQDVGTVTLFDAVAEAKVRETDAGPASGNTVGAMQPGPVGEGPIGIGQVSDSPGPTDSVLASSPEDESGLAFASPPGPQEVSSPFVVEQPPEPPPLELEVDESRHLFLLSIGVSDLRDDDDFLGDLQYAADDAEALAEALSADNSDAFGQVSTWLLTDDDATTPGIRTALDELSDAVHERAEAKRQAKITVDDVVVFFYTGHGLTSKRPADDEDQFYLVTHDYVGGQVPDSCLSTREVGRVLASLPAYVVVLVDACKSGAAAPDRWKASSATEVTKGLTADDDGHTLFVLTATGDRELAYEHRLWVPYRNDGTPRQLVGHGLFTHGILRRLANDDEGVSMLGLAGGVRRYVHAWTRHPKWKAGRQRPRVQLRGNIDYLEIFHPRTSNRST